MGCDYHNRFPRIHRNIHKYVTGESNTPHLLLVILLHVPTSSHHDTTDMHRFNAQIMHMDTPLGSGTHDSIPRARSHRRRSRAFGVRPPMSSLLQPMGSMGFPRLQAPAVDVLPFSFEQNATGPDFAASGEESRSPVCDRQFPVCAAAKPTPNGGGCVSRGRSDPAGSDHAFPKASIDREKPTDRRGHRSQCGTAVRTIFDQARQSPAAV